MRVMHYVQLLNKQFGYDLKVNIVPEKFLPDTFIYKIVELVIIVYLEVALVNIPGCWVQVLDLNKETRMHVLYLIGAAFEHQYNFFYRVRSQCQNMLRENIQGIQVVLNGLQHQVFLVAEEFGEKGKRKIQVFLDLDFSQVFNPAFVKPGNRFL